MSSGEMCTQVVAVEVCAVLATSDQFSKLREAPLVDYSSSLLPSTSHGPISLQMFMLTHSYAALVALCPA